MLERFGFEPFKCQLEVIQHLELGGCAFTLWPTGSVESVPFWVVPLRIGKTALILLPNVATMVDQVRELQGFGLDAVLLGSQQPDPSV